MFIAGYDHPLSPCVENFYSLSDTISEFITIKKIHNIGEWETYARLIQIFSHWIWATGMRKGQKLNQYLAEAFLRVEHFDENHLEAVYVAGPCPPHCYSMEIQNLLGDTKVDEYGTFLNEYSRSRDNDSSDDES